MRKSKFFITASVILSIAVAGCGGGPKGPVPPESSIKSAELISKAGTAYDRGKLEHALALYGNAFNLGRSVEDVESMAISAINMATTFRAMGQPDKSHEFADYLLNNDHLKFNDARLAEAAAVKALCYMDAADHQNAISWIDKSSGFCAKSPSCADHARIMNIRAKAVILSGRFEAARQDAAKGLELSKKADNKIEIANSHRAIGEAEIALNNPDAAISHFTEALNMDKDAGHSRKIALDLMGLGRAHAIKGDSNAAAAHYKRAVSVGQGAGDQKTADEAKSLLDKLRPQN